MTESIKALAKEFKFIVEPDKSNKNIDHIIFDDGRHYKFQHPSFMELHAILFDAGKGSEQAAFEHALTIIFPENQKSPPINEKFLNNNFNEGMYLWSPLLRRLLFRS